MFALPVHLLMIQSIFQEANWYRAATLVERIAPHLRCNISPHEKSETEAAERRRLRWRSQPPFTKGSTLVQRLAADGIIEEEFVNVLGEGCESLRGRFSTPPPWLTDLAQAFSNDSSKPIALPEPPADEPAWGLLNSIEPVITYALLRLRQGIGAITRQRLHVPFDLETVERVFLPDLLRQLAAMVGRTMVLELNVARIEGLLDGDTPEERFRAFLNRVRQPEIALAILHEYPVLARQLSIRLDQWVGFVLEFLERLCADWDLIRCRLCPDEAPGFLAEAQSEAGDKHRSGRSTVIAKFSSGFRLIYKPRSMAVDLHFQELLNWINDRGIHPGFRTLQILHRDGYGWAEFVAAETCDSPPAVRRFYERLGGYLALLYMLQASDFHCENLIAAGEQPVLIDLEALFHPALAQAGHEGSSTVAVQSVLDIGLLPQRDYSTPESEGLDLSGLGGAAGQITPYGVPYWENAGTDEMRLSRKRRRIPASQNRPSLNGAEVDPCDYANEIMTGFSGVYRLLEKQHHDLLSSQGPLSWFADDEVRAVFRMTRTYSVLLYESFHPDVLRDALDRDMLFDRLWVAVESRPYLARLIFAERDDLQKGDIPLFSTRPASRHVWTSSGEAVRDFLDEPTLALVQRRLLRFSERDLSLQLWMIRASLATTAVGHDDRKYGATSKPSGSQDSVDHDRLLKAARIVGDRLELMAIRWNGKASWFGLMLANERHWSISPLTADLYDGLPGIALFLAYLGAVTEEARYTALAHETCSTMLRSAEESKSWLKSIGGFVGWGGIIYALAHLSALWHEPELLNKADAVVAILAALIEQDEHFDVIAGAAGCVASLLALYRQAPSQRTLAAAVHCGDHLIAHAQRTGQGVGWIVPNEVKPLSGFAHGAAGIAWALLKLAALSGQDRFHRTALAAIAHERTLFSPEAGNWRDLRVTTSSETPSEVNRDSFLTAWCNGAPGIGLARLSTIQYLGAPDVYREIEDALNTTLNHGFGRNHSLCHGDLGNLELLSQAQQVLNDSRWDKEAHRIAANIVESVARNEYLCGTPLRVDSPGLMTGFTGIGYGLLRLAEPARIPSVLMLEPALQD